MNDRKDFMKEREQLLWELEVLTSNMDVPVRRKRDFRWLNRNLAIRNSKHPSFDKVRQIIKRLSVISNDSMIITGNKQVL